MAMAASDVAISLVICSSLPVLSVEKFLSPGKHARIEKAVNDLQNILNTSKLLESSTNDGQQSCDCRPCLLDQARHAVDMADKLLLEASRHLKSGKGPLAKIRTLVHFMLPRICIHATIKMALDFVTIVEDLSTHLSQMQDLSQDPLNLDKTAALWNAHRGSVRWDGKVESDIVGREDEVTKLLAQLIGEDGNPDALSLRVISVVGEEAIGKTALVRSVFNRLEIGHSFQCRIWVHVPEEFTMKDLLVEIMKQLAVQELKDLEHKGEENIKEIIHKSLVELRYLVVFDNLRKVEDMDKFMILLADSRRGSRVIITTRIPEIPSPIDPWASPVELNELDTDGRECLLRECGTIADDPGLKARILSKCSGSPPRILLLGGLVVASSDYSAAMVDQLADNATLSDIMSLSYHKLPSLLKPCLLYLCLFPKESVIPIRRLFRLWHAEGWVRASLFTAEECFEELAGRNLVQVVRRRKLSGRPKSCRVPSFIYDFLCEMATRLGLLQIHSNTERTDHSEKSEVSRGGPLWTAKYEDDKREDHQHSGIRLQQLRSYVSFYKKKLGTRLIDMEELLWPLIAKGDCGLLRVLDLEGVYKLRLPDRLGNVLPNLRYLGLRWTALDSIPESVGNMSSLETLDLKYTSVRNLPSSIWKVKSLQHLYMNEVRFDDSTSHCKPSAKNLSNLQTLWGLYIEATKSPMLDVLNEMTRVEKLGLTCSSPVVKDATERISKLTMIRSLKLRSRDLFGQPSDLNLSDLTGLVSLLDLYLLGGLPRGDSLKLLPQNLRILTLSMSGLDDNPMPVLGGFQSLEILNLLGGSYTGKKLICGSGSFPSLRVLKLWKLEGVEDACVHENALRCLEQLEIKNCGVLTSIDSLDRIESLKQIRLIKVKEELATNIKGGLTRKVFIKEEQLIPLLPLGR
ncbi:hypothetical protein ACJRO7_031117 [Eucalyptus globulus]|uniref:NB-ARC domain-containing protein n=1 Tax=Eucalyptus globulus TaxID=34317 RepID=A0ABD3JJ75_EUCGL